jgi:hypothetical protein
VSFADNQSLVRPAYDCLGPRLIEKRRVDDARHRAIDANALFDRLFTKCLVSAIIPPFAAE